MADPDAVVLVAEVDGALVGYLLGHGPLTFHANGPVAAVSEVAVAAGHRGAGVGRALMGAFEDWAAARGAPLVGVATRRAAGFYGALGYAETATVFRRRLGGAAPGAPGPGGPGTDARRGE